MVDTSITATEVLPDSDAAIRHAIVGEAATTITQGEAIRISSTDGKAYLADCTEESGACSGVAVSSAYTGQVLAYQGSGADVVLGASASISDGVAVLSEDGGIAPVADLTSGDNITILGVFDAANDTLKIKIHASGVEV